MSRNFDEVHNTDRSFTLAGEEFGWRYLHWSEWADWIDGVIETSSPNGSSAKKEEKEEDPTLRESIEQLVERITLFLIPEDRERFVTLANDPEKNVSWLQLNEIRDWMVEVQTGRPTQSPSTSTTGRGKTAASSRAS